MLYPPHIPQSLEILQEPLKNSMILSEFSWAYSMARKYFIKLFHVVSDEDLNEKIKKSTW